jgi:putative peptidoglycan lipid II flippase
VPLAARLRKDDPSGISHFRAELLGMALLLGLLLALCAALLLPPIVGSGWLALPQPTAEIALKAIPGLVLLLPLGIVTSLFSAWMLAAGLHANTLLEGVPAILITLAILVCPGDVQALVWGTVAGFAVHMICLAVPLHRRRELLFPKTTMRSPAWRFFRQSFVVLLLGNALMSLVEIVDLVFTVSLGIGAISTLGYGNRVLALLLGLGGTAVSRATLPIFSKVNFAGGTNASQRDRIHAIAIRWVGVMFGLGIVAMVMVWWLAPYVIKQLFERGAFNATDTAAVAEVLRYGAVQLPLYFAGLVAVSSLVARGLTHVVAICAVLNLLVKVGANFLFVPHFGINGIVLATGMMYAVSCSTLCLCALHLYKRRDGIQ